MDFNHIFEQQAKKQASCVLKIFADKDINLDCADLALYSRHMASWLLDHGVTKGTPVICWMGNVPEFVILLAACMRVGAVLVPLSIYESVDYIQKISEECGAKYVFWDSSNKYIRKNSTEGLRGVDVGTQALWGKYRLVFLKEKDCTSLPACELQMEDELIILYTSGSTGQRKGIKKTVGEFYGEKTFHVFYANVPSFAKKLFPLNYFNLCPWYHTAGFGILMMGLISGYGQEVTVERYKILEIAEYLNKYKITLWQGTATMLYRACVNAKEPVKKLPSVIISTGEALPQYVIRELEKYPGASVLVSGYGTTEAGGIANMLYGLRNLPLPLKIMLVVVRKGGFVKNLYKTTDFQDVQNGFVLGNVSDNVEVIIYDEECAEAVEEGCSGEICAKTPSCSVEYVEGYDQAIYLNYKGERYVRTGDIGYIKGDLLYLSGRKKNMIIRSGENIIPAEIEQVIECFPGVNEVVVCGVPDKEYGEAVCACMEVEAEEFELEKLKQKIQEKLPKYMLPSQFVIMDEIPMNASGKKDVKKVKEMMAK